MRLLSIFVAVLGIVVAVTGAAQEFKKGCKVAGEFVPVGGTIQPSGRCELAQCKGNNKITTQACAEMGSGERCFKKPADVNKPYPDCCPQWLCN